MHNLKLEPLFNPVDIKLAVKKDNLYMTLLGLEELGDWEPNVSSILWFRVLKDKAVIAIIFFNTLGNNCLSFHGGIYKDYRGEESKNYLKEALTIIKNKSDMALITTINRNNKPAQRLVENIGFVLKAVIKNGYKDSDLLLYGEK